MIELGGDSKPHFNSTNLHKTEKTSPIPEKKQEEGKSRGMERERKVKENDSRKGDVEIIRRWLNSSSRPFPKIPLNSQTCRNPSEHTPVLSSTPWGLWLE